MEIDVVKNKRKSKCAYCRQMIKGKHKVVLWDSSNAHLGCVESKVERWIEHNKKEIKMYHKLRAKLKRLNKEIILEKLDNGGQE